MDLFALILPFFLFTSIVFIFLSKNPVYGVLAFVFVVMQVVALLIALDAEFLAYVLAIVYIGAIVVLFLFVIMMFDIYQFNTKRSFIRGCIEYYLLGSLMTELAYYFKLYKPDGYTNMSQVFNTSTIIEIISSNLYNEYFLLIVLGAVIMLLGMMGTIVLTVKKQLKIKNSTSSRIRNSIQTAIDKFK